MFLDAHTHILPGIDDGAQNMEEALSMLKKEAEDEVSHILLTPHAALHGNLKECEYEWEHITKIYEALCDMAKKEGIDINLHLGAELMYTSYTAGMLKNMKNAYTLSGTDYVMVEFDTDVSFEEMLLGLRQILNEGFKPVLAHFERYSSLYIKQTGGLVRSLIGLGDRRRKYDFNMDNVMKLKSLGIVLQVNANSISRDDSLKVLLEDGIIGLVGSDCHRMDWRAPNMNLVKDIGKEKGLFIFEENISI